MDRGLIGTGRLDGEAWVVQGGTEGGQGSQLNWEDFSRADENSHHVLKFPNCGLSSYPGPKYEPSGDEMANFGDWLGISFGRFIYLAQRLPGSANGWHWNWWLPVFLFML